MGGVLTLVDGPVLQGFYPVVRSYLVTKKIIRKSCLPKTTTFESHLIVYKAHLSDTNHTSRFGEIVKGAGNRAATAAAGQQPVRQFETTRNKKPKRASDKYNCGTINTASNIGKKLGGKEKAKVVFFILLFVISDSLLTYTGVTEKGGVALYQPGDGPKVVLKRLYMPI